MFPPPHKFFFARENEVNGGYVYTRKDNDSSFSLGVMQPERCEGYDPWGVSPEVWNHRASTARSQAENCALYNAPPGTVQRMAAFYYLSPTSSHATQQAVMAYTHDDVYKPVPGFKTVTGHFHLELNEMVRDRGTSDFQPTWVPVFRGLGINIVYLGDFHDDSDGTDPGPKRLPEQKDYFEASAKLSDKDFLVMPAGRGERVHRRTHLHHDAGADLLYASATTCGRERRLNRMFRAMARCTTWGRQLTCCGS